ncbi:hypothetical protein HT031_004761 [Scenedesmus sp. PABB004]|nr:hypothetical protein HT031_004761 [Scenedesmus sp. PABB004]
MVLRSAPSTSYGSFEAELEGAILQQTGAVDFFLETAAWGGPCSAGAAAAAEHASPAQLRAVFASDVEASFWQAFNAGRGEISLFDDSPRLSAAQHAPRGAEAAFAAGAPAALLLGPVKRRPRTRPLHQQTAESRLEAYLAHDVQRYVALREQLDAELDADAAALPAAHSRRASSGSFVRLPDPLEADEDGDEGSSVDSLAPPALAAAAAMAAVRDALAGSAGAAASLAARSSGDGAAAGEPAAAGPASARAAASAPPPFTMETDEDLAVQKAAARTRLAELQGDSSAGAPPPALPAGKSFDDEPACAGGLPPGSVHSSRVPQRPRGLRALAAPCGKGEALCASGKGEALCASGTRRRQHRFQQVMLLGLLACVMLMPLLGGLQAWASASLPAWLSSRAQRWGAAAYLPAAAGALAYVLRASLALRPPLLHFAEPGLEARYLRWSNSGKVFVDGALQALALLVGGCLWLRLERGAAGGGERSAAGGEGGAAADAHARALLGVVGMMAASLPAGVLLALRRARYVRWREQLLAGSRLCSVAVLLAAQLGVPGGGGLPLSMPAVALAQLMGIACMQVRLATYVPCQVLFLGALLLRTHAGASLLHYVQLLGGGLCLPCLLLHSMEMYSRKAFLATLANAGGGGGAKKTV